MIKYWKAFVSKFSTDGSGGKVANLIIFIKSYIKRETGDNLPAKETYFRQEYVSDHFLYSVCVVDNYPIPIIHLILE